MLACALLGQEGTWYNLRKGVATLSLQRARITYQDYLQMPEGERYEVLEGDLKMVPAPSERHQRAVLALSYVLVTQVERPGLGRVNIAPLDVILDDDTVVQPDLCIVLKDRLSIVAPEGLRGAPDLVVEVLSPRTAARDRDVKRRLYGRYGVREYWIVDPDGRTVEVLINSGGNMAITGVFAASDRVESPLLSTLELVVDQLFTDLV